MTVTRMPGALPSRLATFRPANPAPTMTTRTIDRLHATSRLAPVRRSGERRARMGGHLSLARARSSPFCEPGLDRSAGLLIPFEARHQFFDPMARDLGEECPPQVESPAIAGEERDLIVVVNGDELLHLDRNAHDAGSFDLVPAHGRFGRALAIANARRVKCQARRDEPAQVIAREQ